MSPISVYISVIVPTYNACERLFLALEALSRQSFDHNLFEVIVIDDGSQDDTFRMLGHTRYSFQLNIIRLERNFGRSYARNRGILASQGKLLIFSDGDMIPCKDYIQEHANSNSCGDKVVIGPIWNRVFTYRYRNFNNEIRSVYNRIAKGVQGYSVETSFAKPEVKTLLCARHLFTERFKQYTYIPSWGNWYQQFVEQYGNNFEGLNFPWILLGSGNMSVGKNKIMEAGLFDKYFMGWGGEDWEVGYRLYKLGLKFLFNGNALSFHQEHPYDEKERSFYSKKNQLYMLEKHRDFEVFAILFGAHLGYDQLNRALGEYNILKTSKDNRHLAGILDNFAYHYYRTSMDEEIFEWYPDNETIYYAIAAIKDIYGYDSPLVNFLKSLTAKK